MPKIEKPPRDIAKQEIVPWGKDGAIATEHVPPLTRRKATQSPNSLFL